MLKHCEHCKVDVQSPARHCPLCQSPLTGEYTGDKTFPEIQTVYKNHAGYIKLIRFCFVAIMALSILANLFAHEGGAWSVLVVAAVSCIWLWLYIAIRRRRNILKKLFDQVWMISLLAVFWDFLIGWEGWSLNYIVPGVFICAMLTVSILSFVTRISAPDYIVYATLLITFGVIPAILLLTDLVNVPHVAAACLFVSTLLFIKMLIFDWSVLSHELKKRLHM